MNTDHINVTNAISKVTIIILPCMVNIYSMFNNNTSV